MEFLKNFLKSKIKDRVPEGFHLLDSDFQLNLLLSSLVESPSVYEQVEKLLDLLSQTIALLLQSS